MSEDGTPLTNRDQPMPVESRLYPDDDPDGRTYHYYVRQLLEELNAHTVYRDAYANRQDYTPLDGALFVPEETGQPWAIGDGTSWVERDWTGADPTFSTATVETAPSAGTDVVRKTEHDTKADADGGGTAELTNYAAIDTDELAISDYLVVDVSDYSDVGAAANDALTTVGSNGVAIIPPGNYSQTAEIAPQAADQEMWAYGVTSRVANAAEIKNISGGTTNFAVRGGTWDANAANQSSVYPQAIELGGADGITVADVTVRNGRQSIDLYNGSDFLVSNVRSEFDVDGVTTGNAVSLVRAEDSVVNGVTGLIRDTGVLASRCENLHVEGVSVRGDTTESASFLFDVLGTSNSYFAGTLHGQGVTAKGVFSHPYDIGGANEEISKNNHYTVTVNGADSYGVHLEDSTEETVKATVVGTDNGEPNGTKVTSRGVFTNEPNNLGGGGHEIDVHVTHTTDRCIWNYQGDYCTIGGYANDPGTGHSAVQINGYQSEWEGVLGATPENGLTATGTGNLLNGVGEESANAETPTAADWQIGAVVDFVDSGDDSGTGVYQLMPDVTWTQLA